MKKRVALVCQLAVFAMTGLQAQESLSLSQAIEKGLKQNFQVQIAEREVAIAQNDNNWAVAGKYPSIDLTLNVNNNYQQTNNPASFLREFYSIGSGVQPGIEAVWILFDGYRIRFTKQQLETLERLSQGNAQVAVENAIESVILAYYNALVESEQLQVRQRVLNLSRDRLSYERVRQEYGQASSFDVLQTNDAYINDSMSYLIQRTTYENALRNLNTTMGEPDLSVRFTLTDQLAYEAPVYDLEALRSRMLANNRSLQNLQVSRELARIQTDLRETTRQPRIDLRTGAVYNYNRNHASTGIFASGEERDLGGITSSSFNGFINFSASYTLFDWGLRQRQIERSKMEELIAQLNINDLQRTLTNNLENTWAQYNNQKELLDVTTQLVNNAQRNLEIAEERFRGGLINSFDYRTIQLGYINATQSQLNAYFNLKTTETELIRLIGGLVR
ncbi:MAG: TolC family protein [Saprospiraceae bacterium]|jgi:outer membrane protein TolC|nr:TolC family protein [Saprospiraceae bacterium]